MYRRTRVVRMGASLLCGFLLINASTFSSASARQKPPKSSDWDVVRHIPHQDTVSVFLGKREAYNGKFLEANEDTILMQPRRGGSLRLNRCEIQSVRTARGPDKLGLALVAGAGIAIFAYSLADFTETVHDVKTLNAGNFPAQHRSTPLLIAAAGMLGVGGLLLYLGGGGAIYIAPKNQPASCSGNGNAR